MSSKRPEWLTEDCPVWCDGDHGDQHLLEDRRHHSDYRIVPVIQHRADLSWGHPPSPDDVDADQLNALARRDVGAQETWVVIANDAQRVEVTLESAARLHRALGGLLDRAMPDAPTTGRVI